MLPPCCLRLFAVHGFLGQKPAFFSFIGMEEELLEISAKDLLQRHDLTL
jgi:hypothetical protein